MSMFAPAACRCHLLFCFLLLQRSFCAGTVCSVQPECRAKVYVCILYTAVSIACMPDQVESCWVASRANQSGCIVLHRSNSLFYLSPGSSLFWACMSVCYAYGRAPVLRVCMRELHLRVLFCNNSGGLIAVTGVSAGR